MYSAAIYSTITGQHIITHHMHDTDLKTAKLITKELLRQYPNSYAQLFYLEIIELESTN